jgi:hypothetical protein
MLDWGCRCRASRRVYHRVQSGQRSTNGETSEAGLGDGTVNHPLLAEAVEQALCDLVTVMSSAKIHRGATAPIELGHPNLRPLNHPLYSSRCPGAQLSVWIATYAPLYCATSSPSTKTLSFCSISSAIASLSASRTVISLLPPDDAYPLLPTIDGIAAVARNAGRNAGRAADRARVAGRRSLEAAIADAMWGIEVEEKGAVGERWPVRWKVLVLTVYETFRRSGGSCWERRIRASRVFPWRG